MASNEEIMTRLKEGFQFLSMLRTKKKMQLGQMRLGQVLPSKALWLAGVTCLKDSRAFFRTSRSLSGTYSWPSSGFIPNVTHEANDLERKCYFLHLRKLTFVFDQQDR